MFYVNTSVLEKLVVGFPRIRCEIKMAHLLSACLAELEMSPGITLVKIFSITLFFFKEGDIDVE